MKAESKHIVGYWHYGVILTYMAVTLGIVGIVFSAMGRAGDAVVCLLFAGLCDAFDGVVARTRKNRSDGDKAFGIQIDSLSDLIAFGVCPVMIGFAMNMREWYYIILFCVYVLCAVIRLGFFNTLEGERQANTPEMRAHFEGLPVTMISLVLPIFYYIATMFERELVQQMIMLFMYVVYMALMVIRFKMPKPHVKGLVIMIVLFLSTIAAMFLVRWFVIGIHTT